MPKKTHQSVINNKAFVCNYWRYVSCKYQRVIGRATV